MECLRLTDSADSWSRIRIHDSTALIACIEVHCKVGDKMLKTTVSALSEEMKGDVYVDSIYLPENSI